MVKKKEEKPKKETNNTSFDLDKALKELKVKEPLKHMVDGFIYEIKTKNIKIKNIADLQKKYKEFIGE